MGRRAGLRGSAKINMRGDARRKPVYLHANIKENKSCFVLFEYFPSFYLLIHLGHSALHIAAKNGHPEYVKKLLQVSR